MAKKMTSRDRQAIATKSKIYQCGVRLMNQHGYDRITVEQIARKANVSIGTYYHYFQSKFDLFVEIYRHGDEFFKENISDLLGRQEQCAGRIEEYFVLYAQLSINCGIEMTRNLYVSENKMFITHGRTMQSLLTNILRLGQERGELTDSAAPEIITEKLFLVARGVIFDWCLRNGESDLIAEMKDIISRQAQSYLLS